MTGGGGRKHGCEVGCMSCWRRTRHAGGKRERVRGEDKSPIGPRKSHWVPQVLHQLESRHITTSGNSGGAVPKITKDRGYEKVPQAVMQPSWGRGESENPSKDGKWGTRGTIWVA